jgi:cytochrome c-type biogenesis protein CcmH
MTVRRRMRALCLAVLMAVWFAPIAAHALDPDEIMANPQLEARARAISSQLRCLVCQNESIEESQAPLAKDLRGIVRQRLRAGDSDAQIKAYLVARYGDFILLKPPFEFKTLLLWLAPALCLAGGGLAAWRAAKAARRRLEEGAAPLSEAERLRLAGLLAGPEEKT